MQVTDDSVLLLGRQWNIYLHTRELCTLVLFTTTLGIVHFNPGDYFPEHRDIPSLWQRIDVEPISSSIILKLVGYLNILHSIKATSSRSIK
jgi:hypothetical protein